MFNKIQRQKLRDCLVYKNNRQRKREKMTGKATIEIWGEDKLHGSHFVNLAKVLNLSDLKEVPGLGEITTLEEFENHEKAHEVLGILRKAGKLKNEPDEIAVVILVPTTF